jgi:hypothetical protein
MNGCQHLESRAAPAGRLIGDAPLRPQLSEIEEVRWLGPVVARRTISFENSQATLDAAIAGLERLKQAS